jgi:hypothetical protein
VIINSIKKINFVCVGCTVGCVAWRGVVWCGVVWSREVLPYSSLCDVSAQARLYSTLLYSTMRRNKLNVVSTGQGLRQRRKLSTIRFHGFATLDFDSDSTLLLLLLLLQHLFRERERKNESNRIESSSPLHSLTHSLTHFPLTPTARHTPFLFSPHFFHTNSNSYSQYYFYFVFQLKLTVHF